MGLTGLEPVTFAMSTQRSNQLSYNPSTQTDNNYTEAPRSNTFPTPVYIYLQHLQPIFTTLNQPARIGIDLPILAPKKQKEVNKMNMLLRKTYSPFAEFATNRNSFDHMQVQPAIDVSENTAAYTVKAALPGWKPEQVDVTFEDGVLTLKGDIATETEAPEAEAKPENKIHWKEIRQQSFVRSLTLPLAIETEKVNADFENGVLTLTLPKAEVIKPKQIRINVK